MGTLANGETSEPAFPEVDGYDILAELGHGGMGVVYEAHQRRLSRRVALKMIRAGNLARPEDRARFRIEAEAVAKLRHPNIIQIYDIDEVGGLPFVAFELLEGGSLDESLGGIPQPGRPSATLVATLARAVHAAHLADIVHRDLKPSNVLFARDGTPKITDFGLAKRLEEDGPTETGQVLGSPSYIPPEQARGEAKEVGPAADIYALGAILYEMLTGRPPFKGTTPMETVLQVIDREPVPPSRLECQVPRDLETICLRCLAKQPRRRYPSAEALADDLDRYLANRPIRARRTPLWERGLKSGAATADIRLPPGDCPADRGDPVGGRSALPCRGHRASAGEGRTHRRGPARRRAHLDRRPQPPAGQPLHRRGRCLAARAARESRVGVPTGRPARSGRGSPRTSRTPTRRPAIEGVGPAAI